MNMEHGVNQDRVILAVGRSGKGKTPSQQQSSVQPSAPEQYTSLRSIDDLDDYTLKSLRCVGFWSWFWLIIFGLNLIGYFVMKFNPDWLAPIEATEGALRYFLTVFVFNFVFIFKGTVTALVLFMFAFNRMAYYNTAVEMQDANGLLNSIYYKKYESPAYDLRTGRLYQQLGVVEVMQHFKYLVGPMLYLFFAFIATAVAFGITGYYFYNVLMNRVALSIADAFLMLFVCYEAVFILRYLYSAIKVRIIESN